MKVKVRSVLSKKNMGEVLEFRLHEGTSIKTLFEEIKKNMDGEFAFQLFEPDSHSFVPQIVLMVNGRNIDFLNGMETVLQDGDEILILRPFNDADRVL